jgi:hypothetical protein
MVSLLTLSGCGSRPQPTSVGGFENTAKPRPDLWSVGRYILRGHSTFLLRTAKARPATAGETVH